MIPMPSISCIGSKTELQDDQIPVARVVYRTDFVSAGRHWSHVDNRLEELHLIFFSRKSVHPAHPANKEETRGENAF
jgi:hypothetical protein